MRTPLYDTHKSLGARFTTFAGWEMPVQYAGIIEEHQAVRQHAGLFDVSHMGEIELRGSRAIDVVQEVTVNDASRLQDGQVQYSLLCLPAGGVVDDITVHRLSVDRYLLCVNASNTAKDFEWIRSRALGRAEVLDRSPEFGQLALQGPLATAILSACCRVELSGIRPFWFREGEVAGVRALIARTGYTGEDGWELYCAADDVERLWARLLDAGGACGLVPAGLGARDTLRIERALPLYGHELTEEVTPVEAGLERFVHVEKAFIGRDALQQQLRAGTQRRLVGLALREPGIPRQGYAIRASSHLVGVITSGTKSPTLGKAVGLGYVKTAIARVGALVEVEIRNRGIKAELVALPFYRRR